MKIDDAMMHLSLLRKLLTANKSYSKGLAYFVNVNVITAKLKFSRFRLIRIQSRHQ
jgi:hypothetical protein